jgi:hypothetical protein
METKTLFARINQNKRKTAPSTYMATLTYRPGEVWESGDIKRVTAYLKRRFGSWLLSLAWVFELQLRGAPHYHLFATFAKGSMPMLDRAQGERDFVPWFKGSTRVEKAKSIFYLSKYIGKEHQKDYDKFPRGVRSFGIWVSALYNWECRNQIRATALPKWVTSALTKENFASGKLQVSPAKGGGWEINGNLLCSDYEFIGVTDKAVDGGDLFEWWKEGGGVDSVPVGMPISQYLEIKNLLRQ